MDTAVPTFFYVGNTASETVADMISAALVIPRGEAARYPTKIAPQVGAPARKTEEMPLCQGKLAIGYRTDISLSHPLAAAMTVLNEIFGGSPASKLFLNVREKRSLCYHCESSLDLYKGTIMVSADMKAENREAAETAVHEEFHALLRGEISDVELHAAKRSLDHTYHQTCDVPSSLSDFYMARVSVGNRESVEERRAAVAAVTRDEIAEAAKHVREGAVYFLQGTLSGEEEEE